VILPPEEGDFLDPQGLAGRALLFSHDGSQLPIRIVRAIQRALLAIGHDEGLDFVPFRDQFGDRTAAEERQIVGVGFDNEIPHFSFSPLSRSSF
jgi:hypothetical protein